MKTNLTGRVQDAGYEALFFLGGFLAMAIEPTRGNCDNVTRWVAESSSRQAQLRRLKKRGLIATDAGKGDWVPRLTDLGHAVFAGGRHPEKAWNRSWDGTWRLLTFDLPRQEHPTRLKFGRWLCANRFGRLQGSVWISPDPVADIESVIANDRIDPSKILVFEGGLAGSPRPWEIATIAWDFDAINAKYRSYTDSASRTLQQIQRKPPPPARLREILCKDRKAWGDAIHPDPLLPKDLLPRNYEGSAAWQIRCKLLKNLGNATVVNFSPTAVPAHAYKTKTHK